MGCGNSADESDLIKPKRIKKKMIKADKVLIVDKDIIS